MTSLQVVFSTATPSWTSTRKALAVSSEMDSQSSPSRRMAWGQVKPAAVTLLSGNTATDDDQVVLAYHRFGRGLVAAFTVQDSWLWLLVWKFLARVVMQPMQLWQQPQH